MNYKLYFYHTAELQYVKVNLLINSHNDHYSGTKLFINNHSKMEDTQNKRQNQLSKFIKRDT